MTSNTTHCTLLLLVPFPTISRYRFSTSESLTRLVPLPWLKVSTVMPLMLLHSTQLQRPFWQPDRQTSLLACGTCATSSQNCMRSSATPNQSRLYPGIHLRSPSWQVPAMTGRSCSGTSAGLVRSRLQRMRRMDRLNCMLCPFQHPASH